MLQYLPILFASEFVCPGLIELPISCTNISCIFPILSCIIALGYFSRISLDKERLFHHPFCQKSKYDTKQNFAS